MQGRPITLCAQAFRVYIRVHVAAEVCFRSGLIYLWRYLNLVLKCMEYGRVSG